jgi:ferrous iron transport protein B
MVFVLLYTPCVAALGVIRKETGSWKWTGFSVAYGLVVAWILAFVVGHVAGLFMGGM